MTKCFPLALGLSILLGKAVAAAADQDAETISILQTDKMEPVMVSSRATFLNLRLSTVQRYGCRNGQGDASEPRSTTTSTTAGASSAIAFSSAGPNWSGVCTR